LTEQILFKLPINRALSGMIARLSKKILPISCRAIIGDQRILNSRTETFTKMADSKNVIVICLKLNNP